MKILSVVGARPQFVKLASLAKLLSDNFEHMVLHTGQHYSPDLSDIFFKELQIQKPDFNLGIGSDSHGKQTARMLEGIETALLDIKPEILVVFGDTNSGCCNVRDTVATETPARSATSLIFDN